MTDRELLELAAKASGLPEYGWMGGSLMYVKDNCFVDWNPLNDDGDALRLVVKLRLDFYVDVKQAGCWVDDFVCLFEDINNDPYAATRRAIVRAAAAIGSKL